MRSTEKRRLDRWLKGSTLEEVNPATDKVSRLDLVIISILRGTHAREKDALQITVARQLSLFDTCILWRGMPNYTFFGHIS